MACIEILDIHPSRLASGGRMELLRVFKSQNAKSASRICNNYWQKAKQKVAPSLCAFSSAHCDKCCLSNPNLVTVWPPIGGYFFAPNKEIAVSEEKNEVALASLPSVPAELEAAFIDDNFIDGLIKNIRTKASAVVGDLNTVKGRKVYISMAADVRSTKAMIDEAGKNLVAEMKKRPALVDASRRKVREALDELAVQIRKPVTDWEAEQERLAAEKQMLAWHEQALADNEAFDRAHIERFETDHELALLMNTQHDRDVADAKAEAEHQRIAHEEELKRLAVEQAQREAEERIKQEREAAAKREADLKAQAALAEANRIALAQKAEQDRIDAAAKAEADRVAAAQKAEREKQEAIATEKLKAQQEANRIKLEAQQKENARIAEEQRVAREAAARAADVAHRKTIGTAIVNALTTHAGLTREQAIATLSALKDGNIPHTSIQY